MAFKFLDRAQMTVTGTPGTGAITLNAASTGYQSFSAAGLSDGDTTPYLIVDGSNWEHGVGTYTASGTSLARTTISGSSNAGSAISATSSAIVSSTFRAEDAASLPHPGGVAPAVVQFGVAQAASGNFSSVVLGAAPTNGNLLVAVVFSETSPVLGSGWTQTGATEGAGLWYCYSYTKTAGASESATQTPCTATNSAPYTIAVWEVSGQSATVTPQFVAQYTTTWYYYVQTPVFVAFPNCLCLMALVASVNASYYLNHVSGPQVIDLNNTGGAGAKACYGHSDSTASIFNLSGLCPVNTNAGDAWMGFIFH